MLKTTLPFLFLFVFPLVAFANEWQTLEPGLAYKTSFVQLIPQQKTATLLHIFKIDPKKFDLRPMVAQTGTNTIKQLTNNHRAILGINANFFDGEGRALGLIVDRAKKLNPLKVISWWGVFFIEDEKPFIVHSSQFQNHPGIRTAIQAGPRLVIDGSIPKLKAESSAKTAVGINKRGEVFFVVSKNPIPIQDLARFMAGPPKDGGLGLSHALNFDGGSSTQAYAKSGDFELNLPGFVAIPVGLGVFRKE